MNIIAHNILAMNASRQYGIITDAKEKTTEKLSSGYKVNRAADDACSLTISEKMRSQIRGLKQSRDNIMDGVSYCNVAEGALSEVSDMLHRIKELSIKSANGTNTSADRTAIDTEVQEIDDEIDRIFKTTEFNTRKIWPSELIPMVGGNPQDCMLYSVKDSTGEYYGGIEYMKHRYSWADLGIDFDGDTHTFKQTGDYEVGMSVLKDDASTTVDDFDGSASFKLSTVAGDTADKLIKHYSWAADDQGIRIDGVLAAGLPFSGEGNSKWEAMGITPGNTVAAGDYGFTYYGQNIYFELNYDMGWDSFKAAINDSGKDGSIQIDWVSKVVGTTHNDRITNITSNASKIVIDSSAVANRISDTYQIKAGSDGIQITGGGNSSAVTTWDNISSTNGSYIGSWGTDANNDVSSKTDGIAKGDAGDGGTYTSAMSGNTYTYSSDYLHVGESGTNFELSFSVMDNQSGTEIVQDIGSVSFSQTGIESPTKFESSDKTTEVYVKSSANNGISFYTQRDKMGRSYNGEYESIANDIDINVTAGGNLTMNVNGVDMTSTKTLVQYYNNDTIWSNATRIGNTVVKEYDAAVAAKRSEKYNELFNASDNYSKLDACSAIDSAGKNYNVLDEYIKSGFDAGYLSELFTHDELNTIFSTSDFLATDDKSALTGKINTKWNAMSDSDKIYIFRNDADIASKKTEIWKHDFSTSSQASGNKSKVKSYLNRYAEIAQPGKAYQFIDKNVLGITDDDKVSMFKTARNNHISDSVGAPSNVAVDFTNGKDSATLLFDMSHITYGDVIDKMDDSQLKSYISGVNNTMFELSGCNEAVNLKREGVYNVVKNDFDAVKVDFSGNGSSYQKVSMNQNVKNTGNRVINRPEVIAENTKIKLTIHSGPQPDNAIDIVYDNMRLAKLGIKGMHCDTQENARLLMDWVDYASDKVSKERSVFGAYTNRLESAYDINYNIEENTQAAESQIRDTDMALSMVDYAKQSILEQVAQAMMSQANQSNQGVISLLQ